MMAIKSKAKLKTFFGFLNTEHSAEHKETFPSDELVDDVSIRVFMGRFFT